MKNNYFADFEAFRCADSELRQVLGGTTIYVGVRSYQGQTYTFQSTSASLIAAWCNTWESAGWRTYGYSYKTEDQQEEDYSRYVEYSTDEYLYENTDESYEG